MDVVKHPNLSDVKSRLKGECTCYSSNTTLVMGWWGWEEIRTQRQNMREGANMRAGKCKGGGLLAGGYVLCDQMQGDVHMETGYKKS